MRKLMLLTVPIIPVLAGCAGSVIFGHVIGQDHPTAPVQGTTQEPVPAPAVAVPAASVPAPSASTASAPTPLASTATAPAVEHTAMTAADAKFRAVTLAFTPGAMAKVNSDARFNKDALLASINGQLRSHDLIDDLMQPAGSNQSDRTVEIMIDDFSIRAASNAVVFGYVFNNATLTGKAEVRNATGQALENFEIAAQTHLSTRTDADPAQALGSLYRRFADITVGKLTGVPFKAPETEMPR